eukprot:CAMPEP_0177226272 /NCGR_PEP_ID=MMETSP0367-20130122/39991_1 /TAXON_ID=447022 ORGANISM="Scrippsiella hangoei-like, Strain SHHI-4" /NCGR_SAMPLE_ID=MMETSP0367 /ASSEMBLY_ACC=CAM_ASM_000362 /LENGTH=33 /DNA_ID= /DNA_START= /DNA_END= /DNA_ORIENTATION=
MRPVREAEKNKQFESRSVMYLKMSEKFGAKDAD